MKELQKYISLVNKEVNIDELKSEGFKFCDTFANLKIYKKEGMFLLLEPVDDSYKVFMAYTDKDAKSELTEVVERDNPEPLCVKNVELESLVRKHNGDYCCHHSTLGNHCAYMRIKDDKQSCVYYTRFEK